MKLGFLGPKGTFSFEVAENYAGKSELVEFATITEIITSLKNDEIAEAIVPIENSIQGGVTETMDALIETDGIFVKEERIAKIKHHLMANRKYEWKEIKEVYSHPQALAQCRTYLEKNLKNARINQVSSTALAAKEISQKDFCACIANIACVEEYGLTLLASDIQENEWNQTKFWLMSKTQNEQGNQMSLLFSTKHKPGALYRVLSIFNENQVNLTKIESRPAKTELGDYIFLVDLEINDAIDSVIELLKAECKSVKILGRYEGGKL